MKTEPKIGDTVWAYLDNKLLEFIVDDYALALDQLVGTSIGRHFKLVPKEGQGDLPGLGGFIHLATQSIFPTARDAINDCIRYTNELIRGNKKELDQTRRKIKDLKHRRADFQRMLERYPKSS